MGIKQILIIIEAYRFAKHLENCIQHPDLKVDPICEENNRG